MVLAKVRDSDNPNYGYDAQGNKYGDLLAMGIVDPAKVSRSALENAASVAGMILTTQTLISDQEEEEEHEHDHVH